MLIFHVHFDAFLARIINRFVLKNLLSLILQSSLSLMSQEAMKAEHEAIVPLSGVNKVIYKHF